MAVVSKTRSTLEGLVRDSSLKWLLGKRSYFDEELEELERSPSTQRNWISELSPFANVVVRRCSKILGVSASELQDSFNVEAIDSIKVSSNYARNFLEYCSFRALALSTQSIGYLADKKFRRLTFDMMIAWEAPASSSEPVLNIAEDASVGVEAFSRIAPAVPIISNVIISENLFEMLTSSAGAVLHFSVYDKYLSALEKVIRKMKNLSESNLLQPERTLHEERILEVDGTVTTQPVLEHVGISTWPGRLVLTDHALYFEALRVVSFDKAKRYDLSEDLKQVIKPELAGPWGTRLFDKAILYKSVSLSEPVVIEFPELKGHTRRDFWLAIIREVLYVHRFINKFQIKGIQRSEALSKAVLGILRLQAIQDMCSTPPSLGCESLLMFNLCDQLPGGDLILETLANMSDMKECDRANKYIHENRMYSISAFDLASHLGFGMGTAESDSSENELLVGEIAVGKMTPLERAVKESRNNYEKVVMAQETVDVAKVDGIDTNLAVMKELMLPVSELGNCLLSLARWDDPMQSSAFCLVSSYIIYRDWLPYAFALLLMFMAVFMMLTRLFNQGTPVDEVKVVAPPAMNAMEQLLAVQNAISQAEQFIQDGNIVLLKLRALLLAIFPQATMKFAVCLVVIAIALALLPSKYIILMVFVEGFTRHSPPRRASTERWTRRLREWWFSIPAAPVILERENEDKKRK